MIIPQVESVIVILEPSWLNFHQGRSFAAVVQLKITGSSWSERGNAFEGFVVMPPPTFSEIIKEFGTFVNSN